MARKISPPLIVIMVGIAWLMNVMGVLAGVDWIWPAVLAGIGIAALAFGGVNRVTVVACPFLVTGSIFSVMRQTNRVTVEREVPYLTIALGLYWLIASALSVPMPKWRIWDTISGQSAPPPGVK